MRTPERFCPVELGRRGAASRSASRSRSTSWDRTRLLEDIGRTFAENGSNIVEYGGVTSRIRWPRNWYVVEVGDVKELKRVLSALRNIDSVFDAYRVTPRGGPDD